MYLLERSSGLPKPRSSAPAISTRSTCLAAAAASYSNSSHRPPDLATGSHLFCYSYTSTSAWLRVSNPSHASAASCLYRPSGNTSCAFSSYLGKRSASDRPWWEHTILLVRILVQEQVLFLNHGPWSFPWSNLGNPNLTGTLVTLTQPTAISCIINSVFPFFSGIQARRAEILPSLSPLPVDNFMRLFFRKPVIMFRTSPISSRRTLATRTSLSCSTRTPLSLNL